MSGGQDAEDARRRAWRRANLTPEEFASSATPEEVRIDRPVHADLLDWRPSVPPLPPAFRGLPFVLLGPGALRRRGIVEAELERRGCLVTAERTSTAYPRLAWALYGMDLLDLQSRRRSLLRFSLDRHLYGDDAEECLALAFASVPDSGLRSLKRDIRSALGPIRFFRVTCGEIADTYFTALVHVPDEELVDREWWILEQLTTERKR